MPELHIMQEYWLASFFTGSDVSGLTFSNLETLTCFLTVEHSEEIVQACHHEQARGILSAAVLES